MKNWGKVLAIAVVAALSVLCLAACGGSSGGGAATAAKGPIYVVKHEAFYSSVTNQAYMVGDYEYDEHGNVLSYTSVSEDATTKKQETKTVSYSDYDENGYYAKATNANGKTTNWEYTMEGNHAVKSSNDAGVKNEYTYYSDGKMKSAKMLNEDGSRSTIEYDENGRTKSTTMEGTKYPGTSEYTWELDDKGHVKSYSYESTSEGKTTTYKYTCECDDDGNIIIIYDKDGKLYKKLEYEKIDNPSTYAWIRSFNSGR